VSLKPCNKIIYKYAVFSMVTWSWTLFSHESQLNLHSFAYYHIHIEISNDYEMEYNLK